MATREEHLACLYVLRWARYLRSPHVQSKGEREAAKRLLDAKKRQWREDGRMPIPDDQEEPDAAHVLSVALGALQIHDPTNQEAFLTVELIGTLKGFEHWTQLAGWSRMPYSWFGSGPENMADARNACGSLLAYLAGVLACESVARSEAP